MSAGGRRWDDVENEMLLEFARGKWSVESQRGPDIDADEVWEN